MQLPRTPLLLWPQRIITFPKAASVPREILFFRVMGAPMAVYLVKLGYIELTEILVNTI